jgi:hypothetical protein
MYVSNDKFLALQSDRQKRGELKITEDKMCADLIGQRCCGLGKIRKPSLVIYNPQYIESGAKNA